ncbi:MAG: flagellar export chaperone FliS [Pseudomonadales bacterium]|nr:flagellar export chaperone FliS [Pseudomonadales bacterium]
MSSMTAGYTMEKGAAAYARVGVESSVMAATPHQLIVMLFDGAQLALRSAGLHMQNGNMAEKGRAISKALDIVNQGLLAALDRERGGDVAASLASLYDYIGWLLLLAGLRNDQAKLDEAARLLEDIGSAWRDLNRRSQED